MLWWLSPGEGWDAVGINRKKGATTENQGSGVKYMGKGVYVGCLCVTTPPWWSEKVVKNNNYYYEQQNDNKQAVFLPHKQK